jgi:WD40 repeat protein
VETGVLERSLPGYSGIGQALAFSPEGKVLAAATEKNTVTLWSLPSGDELKKLSGHQGALCGMAFSPDGTVLATAGGIERGNRLPEGEVRLWRMPAHTPLRTLQGFGGMLTSVAWAPDGKRLATTSLGRTDERSFGEVRVWSIR